MERHFLSRRNFIKALGITLAAMATAHCRLLSGGGDSPRQRLRNCWARLEKLEQPSFEPDQVEKLSDQHRAVLDELVAAGELQANVADQIQEAFAAAAYHVWRSHAPITCYLPAPGPNYTPTSSGQLARQAQMLLEMADDLQIDQASVAKAQAAIERDIAFLALTDQETQELYEQLEAAASGDYSKIPQFDQLALEIDPESAVAARFLVELLLEE